MSVRKLGYTQSPSRRDGMLVENTSPTAQSPSRQGRNVEFVDFNVQSRCSDEAVPRPVYLGRLRLPTKM
ncbi:MAG: hypothetical protein LBD59_00840 [Prevotellaceae bacterium]|nr:hypothetical protein [Prevotellaceae bacterium]